MQTSSFFFFKGTRGNEGTARDGKRFCLPQADFFSVFPGDGTGKCSRLFTAGWEYGTGRREAVWLTEKDGKQCFFGGTARDKLFFGGTGNLFLAAREVLVERVGNRSGNSSGT